MAMGWDTNMLLGAYIGTGSFPTEGGVNYAWYSNEEVDNHLAATAGATSEEELVGHLRAAHGGCWRTGPTSTSSTGCRRTG